MYLDKPDEAARIEAINATMKSYLDEGVLENRGEGFVLVRRTVGSSSRIVEKESAMQPFTLDIRRALAAGFAPHDFTSMIGGCLYGGGGSTPDALSTAIDEVAA